jgi:hypothetical protein
MSSGAVRNAWAFGLAGLSLFTGALAAESVPRPDPLDSKASVPLVQYETVFKGYRRFEDESVTQWRAANDLAQRLGGWKAFAGGKDPEVPASASEAVGNSVPAKQEVPASSDGHAPHKSKK